MSHVESGLQPTATLPPEGEPLLASDSAAVAEAQPADVRAPALGRRFFNRRTALSFGIAAVLLIFLVSRVHLDVTAILARVREANPWWLGFALAIFYSTFLIRAARWQMLLRNAGFTEHLDVKLPSLGGTTEIMLLSWFANCIVPAKLGDAYRAYLLKRDAGVSFSTTLGTIVAERVVDVLVLFVLMAAASILTFGRTLPAPVLDILEVGVVLVVVALVALFFLRGLRPLLLRLVPHRFHGIYTALERGIVDAFSGRRTTIVGLSVVAWAAEILRLYGVTLALGFAGVAPGVIIFVALASALATTLPLTPAGLGFAEGAMVAIFLLARNAGLAPGVTQNAAASIALLDRGISYWSLIVVGFFTYLFSKRK